MEREVKPRKTDSKSKLRLRPTPSGVLSRNAKPFRHYEEQSDVVISKIAAALSGFAMTRGD